MASALRQPARPLSGTQAVGTGGGGLDVQQLLAMLLSFNQQRQQGILDAATTVRSPIAKDPRERRAPGLGGWYEMNPTAIPGATFAQNDASRRMAINNNLATQELSNRAGLAELLQRITGAQSDLYNTDTFTPPPARINPFWS